MAATWLARLDTYANETYGRAVSSAIVDGICVSCGGAAHAFTTPEASSAYANAGLCEPCQTARRSIADNVLPFDRRRGPIPR